MIGFCGIVNLDGEPVQAAPLERMAGALAFPGLPAPPRVQLLGPAALAAVDTRGRQPLRSSEGDVWLVADVRLDNRRELSPLLKARGLLDREPADDADLLLAAYLLWGERCVEHFLGDFAFALWDAERRRLFCARDPLGVKSLAYARTGSLFVFAPEARQVLQHPDVPRRLDEAALGDYLSSAAEDTGGTFFRDVRRLPPAHTLTVDANACRLSRYWDIDPERRIVYNRPEDYADHFLRLFEEAVADRLYTPPQSSQSKPFAVAMSGGLDSSAVAAVAQRHLAQSGGGPPLIAASFLFETLRECDESEYIEILLRELGLEPEPVDTERFWLLGDREAYRPTLESPFLAWESSFREMLSRLRSRGVEVLLTGHGADDLLAGSAKVYADRLRGGDVSSLVEITAHAFRRGKLFARVFYNYLAEPLLAPGAVTALRRLTRRAPRSLYPEWISSDFARRTGLAERLTGSRTPVRFRESARQEIYESVLGAGGWHRAVPWYDRNAALYGIEVRHPFLDRRIAELLLAIPPRQLFQVGRYKPLLRSALKGSLPETVRLRKDKTNLGPFVDFGLREKEVGQIQRLLENPVSAQLGILDEQKLKTAYYAYCNTEVTDDLRSVWYALTLEHWLRTHRDTLFSPYFHGSTPVTFQEHGAREGENGN